MAGEGRGVRILVAAVAALMVGTAPGHAQSLGERFERIFGPPVSQDGASPARRQQRAQAPSRPSTPPPAPSNVPLPQERPENAGATSEEPEEPAAAQPDDGQVPLADDDAVETLETGEETPSQIEAEEPSSEAADEPAPDNAVQDAASAPPETPDGVPTPAPADRPADDPDADYDGETSRDVDARPQDADEEAAPEAEQEAGAGSHESEPAAPGGEADEARNDDPPASEPELEPEPTPAYVSPEKARTVPEPAAPEVEPAGVTPDASVEAAAAVDDAMECEEELRARGAEFTVGPSVAEGACGVLRPIQLTRFSAGTAMAPETQMLCRTALALDIWVSEALVPAAREHLDEAAPATLRHASTYVCRDRASENGLSEHGKGSAVDIGALEWEGRAPIVIEAQEAGSPEDEFLADIRRAACGPFRTVLGPGTDADHAEHFHFDIAARSNGSLYCR